MDCFLEQDTGDCSNGSCSSLASWETIFTNHLRFSCSRCVTLLCYIKDAIDTLASIKLSYQKTEVITNVITIYYNCTISSMLEKNGVCHGTIRYICKHYWTSPKAKSCHQMGTISNKANSPFLVSKTETILSKCSLNN